MTDRKRYSFYKGVFSDNALDFSKRSSFIKEVMLERIYPSRVILPMKQNYGVPAIPTVSVGEYVKIGQCVGLPPKGSFGIPVHTGISGTVTDISEITLPNGITTMAVHIKNDMKRNRVSSIVSRNEIDVSYRDLIGIIRDAGICGMGGEGIPTAAKIIRARNQSVSDLLVNCLQSEPYATSDFMMLDEYPSYVVLGASAVARACGVKKISFLISAERKLERTALNSAIELAKKDFPEMEYSIKLFRNRFPQGYFRLIARALYKVELKENETLEEKCHAVLFNCSTLSACWEAISDNIPMMSRIITITSDMGVGHNVLAPIGTPVAEILSNVNNTVETGSRVVWGNALTGVIVEDPENTPIIKLTPAITVIRKQEVPRTPCIHCGLCVESCPMGLSPNIVFEMLVQGLNHKASEEGARDCIACGACSYICPAGINLTGKIAAFASEGKIVGENSLLHSETVNGDKIDLGEITLLENYNVEKKEEENVEDDSISLPFSKEKKV